MKVRKLFHVSGQYVLQKSKDRTLKNGVVKTDRWVVDVEHAVDIRAKTAEEAKEIFDQLGHERYDDMEDYELDVQ